MDPIKTAHTMNKAYTYQKNGVSLNFQLNVSEGSTQRADFVELLKRAVEELTEEIKAV